MFAVSDQTIARWRQARSVLFVVLLTFAMAQSDPGPSTAGRGLVILAGMAVAAAAWIVMTFELAGPRGQPYAVGVCGATGLVLTAVHPGGFAPCYLIAAGSVAVASLPTVRAVPGTLVMIGGLAAVLVVRDRHLSTVAGWTAALLAGLLLGIVRRQRDDRVRQHELLAAEQARAATLAERARLAREIHDVLAHSLSALSVQLETAAALLERDRAADAAAVVDRAGRLARDGLTETRRAVGALRGDPLPLPDLVAELAAGYRADLAAPADVTVTGEPRPLCPETGLALFRGAQEALTNVRKHAPGSAVAVHLEYLADEVRLAVRNTGPGDPRRSPTAGRLPAGYGLAGLRERAELAGGAVRAEPDGDGWRVDVRMPG